MRPEWRKLLIEANGLRERAQLLESASDRLRCKATESGGVRCTADARPEHDHRVSEEELAG